MRSHSQRDPIPDLSTTPRGLPSPRRAAPRTPDTSLTFTQVEDAYPEFIDEATFVRRNSRWTVANYKAAYRNFVRFAQDKRVRSITQATIKDWMRWDLTRNTNTAPATLHTHWRNLRTLFTFIADRDHLPHPFDGLRAPTLGDHVPRAKKPSECGRILDAAVNFDWPHPFDRARAVGIIALAMYAGLRRSEICTLRFLDVDFDAATIFVHAGKGRGGGKQRTVMMNADLRRFLAEYVRERRRLNIGSPEFFSSRQCRRGLSLITLRRIVRTVANAAGVRFGLHDLRASFLTALLSGGAAIHVAAAIAGHSKITTTQRYLSPYTEDMREAVRHVSFHVGGRRTKR